MTFVSEVAADTQHYSRFNAVCIQTLVLPLILELSCVLYVLLMYYEIKLLMYYYLTIFYC